MRLTRSAARIEPRTSGTQRTSRSTAHGAEWSSHRTTRAEKAVAYDVGISIDGLIFNQ